MQKPPELFRPLTKTLFKLACECPTKLFYAGKPHEYADDSLDDSFLRNLAKGGFQVGALAKHSFQGGIEVQGVGYAAQLTETQRLLEAEKVILFEAAFRFGNCFVRADVVEKDGKTLRLYEVKAKSIHSQTDTFWQTSQPDRIATPWKPKLNDVAFQHYVISGARPDLQVVPYLMLVDKTKRATVEGLNQKFRLEKQGTREVVPHNPRLTRSELGESILTASDVSREVEAIQSGRANGTLPPDWPHGLSYAQWVERLAHAVLQDERLAPRANAECKNCQFNVKRDSSQGLKIGFEECWTSALGVTPAQLAERTPVFEIWKLAQGDFVETGVAFVDQLHESDLYPKKPAKPRNGLSDGDRRKIQWEQILSKKTGPYFDKAGFLAEIADYPKPFHFIDFETCTVAVPFNAGRRPYEQIAFQFSHHLLHEDGRLEHATQWISSEVGKFPNFDFIRALRRALGESGGTVFRYASHENTVLNDIRDQLTESSEPDRDQLVAWIESVATPTKKKSAVWKPTRPFVDMLDLVVRFFWHPRMAGSNSIKVALPAILEASEHLQEKYARPLYGSDEIPSLNFEDQTWVITSGGKIQDPYGFLPPIATTDRNTLDRLFGDEELADGGAAMMAYMKLQFSQMTDGERKEITRALLRYCELDTLAMALLWEGWMNL
jgi:hypothetical protein